MIESLERKVAETSWKSRVSAKPCNGQTLTLDSKTYDFSATVMGLFLFPDPDAGAREIYRTLKPGGTACITCWKESNISAIYQAVQAIVKPVRVMDSIPVFDKWAKPETLERTMQEAGFQNLKLHEKKVALEFESEEESVWAMVENYKGILTAMWTDEEKARLEDAVKQVIAERKDLAPVGADGRSRAVLQIGWIMFGEK